MIVEPVGRGSDASTRWSHTLDASHGRIAHRFVRAKVRERTRRYLAGLLDRVERKNGWQLAEAIGEFGGTGVQRLLNAAAWDAEGVRDDLRGYIVDHLGDTASGVLIVDETGFLKQGTKSCGVARQSTGTAGDTVTCEVGVFLADTSNRGAAFIDRALSLPRVWAEDPQRRGEAGIPAGCGSRARSPWPSGCWCGHSRPLCPRAGWSPIVRLWPFGRVLALAGGARPGLRSDDPKDECDCV
jgi:SRSO17 transposase